MRILGARSGLLQYHALTKGLKISDQNIIETLIENCKTETKMKQMLDPIHL